MLYNFNTGVSFGRSINAALEVDRIIDKGIKYICDAKKIYVDAAGSPNLFTLETQKINDPSKKRYTIRYRDGNAFVGSFVFGTSFDDEKKCIVLKVSEFKCEED